MTIDTSYDPRTGAVNGTVETTSKQSLAQVLAATTAAADVVAATSPSERADWIGAVANAVEAHRDELAVLADSETALGLPRLSGEAARCASQLRFYADVAVEGSYLGVVRDVETDTHPSLARVQIPLGPVAVFGASNFPFAFSVLGNDTASALAAGCPVVAKAHPAHPLTSRRLGELAEAALAQAGAPAGTFTVVSGFETGTALVEAPEIQAVAFTGSQAAGLSLWRSANQRDVVIPVFAEMGTINPVVLTRAAAARVDEVAAGFVGSFTLGSGQFCTKPGLLLAPAGSRTAEAVAGALSDAAPQPHMLTQGIAAAVLSGVEELSAAGARIVQSQPAPADGFGAPAVVLVTPIENLQDGSRLLEECFGPVVLVAEYTGDAEVVETLGILQGALAGAIMTGGDDDPQVPDLLAALTPRVGRVLLDSWPTSVAWEWAQNHGGPWPATTDPRTTSVGAAALQRFVRPVTYQGVPEHLLPPPARLANPWSLPQRHDGRLVVPST